MGDRTTAHLDVQGGSEKVRALIASAWCKYTGQTPEEALSGEDWPEVSLGMAHEVKPTIAKILKQGPWASRPVFVLIQEEAVYEYPGVLYRWRPSLGWHYVEIDNGGDPIIGTEWLLGQIDTAPDLATLRENVRSHVGLDWVARWIVGESFTPTARPGHQATRPIASFLTEAEAAAYIATLPGHEDGRYTLDGPSEDE